ncbi:MAG: carboxymuconolactone decarboxylase family protein [Gemmatimonadota bacterium]|nr:carboxymuconolactone decarboxylase family protein [Gemmatimonadota bacterium]
MTDVGSAGARLPALDPPTLELVRLAIEIAAGSEVSMRQAFSRVGTAGLEPTWVEEIILQSYLFAGFPRTLNAAREWRRVSKGGPPVEQDEHSARSYEQWESDGERTCAIVYGEMYERLRRNIRSLHPALDRWMIVDGYGKVLSRPGLDLRRRELCIVAVCGATQQHRQLHSHLHGARHAGATVEEVDDVVGVVAEWLGGEGKESVRRMRHLWARLRNGT